MVLKLGSTDINKAYLGSTEINKLYLGSTEVFDTSGGGGGGDSTVITNLANLTNYTDFTSLTDGAANGSTITRDAGTADLDVSSPWTYNGSAFGGAGGLETLGGGANLELDIAASAAQAVGIIADITSLSTSARYIINHATSNAAVRATDNNGLEYEHQGTSINVEMLSSAQLTTGVIVILMNFKTGNEVDWYVSDGTDYSGNITSLNAVYSTQTVARIGARGGSTCLPMVVKEYFHNGATLTSQEVTDILAYLKSSAGL